MKPQYAEGSQYEFLAVQVKGRSIQALSEPNVKWRDLLLSFYYGPQTGCDAEPNSPGQKSGLITASGLTGAVESVPNLPANFNGAGNPAGWNCPPGIPGYGSDAAARGFVGELD